MDFFFINVRRHVAATHIAKRARNNVSSPEKGLHLKSVIYGQNGS